MSITSLRDIGTCAGQAQSMPIIDARLNALENAIREANSLSEAIEGALFPPQPNDSCSGEDRELDGTVGGIIERLTLEISAANERLENILQSIRHNFGEVKIQRR